jgi:site-specific DNA-methyltransferase (adenine-specific)
LTKKIEYIGCHDSLDLMAQMREKDFEVDAIITDPPYNVSRQSNFHTMGRTGVDFGEWDKGFDIISWIKPSLDILKSGGNIVIFNDWKNMSYIKDELESNGCLIKELIMWKKTNPMPRNRDRLYVTTCEFAIWATKGKGWTFNRQRETYENTIFEYPVVSSKKRIHPTQKPIELMEDLIKIHTNENDIVFDPFGGGFSTVAACRKLNRQYISCDISEEYVEKGKERIAGLVI